jgi:pimeloyl-ACP methyl ester carboxylesterase
MSSLLFLLTMAAAAAGSPEPESVTAPGPEGPLAGTYQPAVGGTKAPVVLILPGSGPTDRDGNNRLGVKAAPYRLLAEALAARGIASVRIDKRGMFASGAAVADANAVTIDDYTADTAAWVSVIRKRTGVGCVWLAGHSEGALIALASAEKLGRELCGVILISAPGRPFGEVLMDQLRANPANAPLLPEAETTLAKLAKGERVDAAKISPPLLPLFAPQVQGFMISLLALDPPRLAAAVERPLLIVQGEADLQTGVVEAERLAAAAPAAKLVRLPGVNHVLKQVPEDDRAANLAAYSDPDRPLAPGVVEAIAEFILRNGT